MSETPANRGTELESSRAPFMGHLEELRWRLLRALGGVIAAAIVCFIFHDEIYEFLTKPLFAELQAQGQPGRLEYRTVHGPFIFHLKTAFLGGIFLGIPIILYQAWQFIAPGLYKSERNLALPFVFMSTIFFIGGGAFAYNFVLPQAFEFLLGYGIDDRLVPAINIEDYLGLVTKLLLSFAIVFEMPIFTAFITAAGLVTHHTLIKWWRWSVVVSFILAALLTPPDYVTQTMMAIPLMLLYGVSIGVSWFITSRRDTPEPEPEPEPPGTEPTEAP